MSRHLHTASLINGGSSSYEGNVLIVGGFDDVSALIERTELYNPESKTWSNLAPLNLARAAHASVSLNDGRVLVMGGFDGTSCVNSVEVFNPASGTLGTWSNLSNMPAALCQHTANILDNGDVAVIGGQGIYGDDSSASAMIYLYDASADSWSTLTQTLPSARFSHQTKKLNDGRLMVLGGIDTSGAIVENGITFDSITQNIQGTASLIVSTGTSIGSDFSMEVLDDGRVLVAGGIDGITQLNRAVLYTPSSVHPGSWQVTESLTSALFGHRSVKLNDGNVMLVGGTTDTDYQTETKIFDVENEKWIYYIGAPYRKGIRLWHTTSKLPDGRIINIGGVNINGSIPYTELWQPDIYDPSTNKWTKVTEVELDSFDEYEYMRFNHTATVFPANSAYPQGGVFIQGGWGSHYNIPRPQIFDVSTNKFVEITPIPFLTVSNPGMDVSSELFGASANLITVGSDAGKILIAGGWNLNTSTDYDTALLYDPENDSWQTTGSMPSPKSEHKSVTLIDGRILVVGSWDSADLSAAIYDPYTRSWSSASNTNFHHGDAIYDMIYTLNALPNGGAILIGGDTPTQSTAEIYDPNTNTWSLLSGLVPRGGHTATQLSSGKILVAGGWEADPITAQIFDPATNSFTATNNSMLGPPLYDSSNGGERYWANAVLLDDDRVFFESGFPMQAVDLVDDEFYNHHDAIALNPTGGVEPYTYEIISGSGTVYPELKLFIPSENFSGAQIKVTSATGGSFDIITIDP